MAHQPWRATKVHARPPGPSRLKSPARVVRLERAAASRTPSPCWRRSRARRRQQGMARDSSTPCFAGSSVRAETVASAAIAAIEMETASPEVRGPRRCNRCEARRAESLVVASRGLPRCHDPHPRSWSIDMITRQLFSYTLAASAAAAGAQVALAESSAYQAEAAATALHRMPCPKPTIVPNQAAGCAVLQAIQRFASVI